MSERHLSKRSKRRLRSRVAVLVAKQLAGATTDSTALPHSSNWSPSPAGSPDRSRSPTGSPNRSLSRTGSPERSLSRTGSPERSLSRTGSPEKSLSTGSPDSPTGSLDRYPSPSGNMLSGDPVPCNDYGMDSMGEVESDNPEVHDSSPDDLYSGFSDMNESGPASISSLSSATASESGLGDLQQHVSTPLFPQANVTTDGFEVAFMSLVQRHNLTYACQSDLLTLFSIVLPSPSMVPSSSHMLISKFINYGKDTVTKRYCGSCLSVLQPGTPCATTQCSNQGGMPGAVFVRVSLAMQLKERFDDPDFSKLLEHRFRRTTKSGVISDIYDGAEYAKHSDFFKSAYDLSFGLNFDGAPKFKSSSIQLWPIQLYLNELPPALRASREYMFLAGVWCSSSKPPTTECLTPILEEIQSLTTVGIKVSVKGEDVVCRARLLFVVADLPAKASLLNIIQYNGKFGCPTCYQEGKQVSIGRGRTRAYGYESITLRNHADHSKHALEAETTKKMVYGVKGKSVLHSLTDFDVIQNVPVDYMHCVLLGVVRLLVSLWFDSKYHREPWYIGNKIVEAEQKLRQVKPPDAIGRIPKAFRGRGWKATECRTFLLYYLPILKGILPDLYLAHAFLLSKSIRILLSDEIPIDDIDFAESLLTLFWRLTEKYYGLKYCKINVHLVSHLPHYVKLFGPLWTHSAFAFEDSIGHLVKKAHGTHDIANQIMTSFILQWRLHVQRKLVHDVPNLTAFVTTMTSKVKTRQQLTSTISTLGVAKNILLESEDEAVVVDLLQQYSVDTISGMAATFYPKVVISGMEISSKYLSRVTKRNNYTVAFTHLGELKYGRVHSFLTCPPDSSRSVHLAIIIELQVKQMLQLRCPPEIESLAPLLTGDFVYISEGCKVAVPIEHIVIKCSEISIASSSVVTTLVSQSEVAK